ncbi:MAG: endonuclease/exonuclease/phosphatase family protein [Aridibacter sp.]
MKKISISFVFISLFFSISVLSQTVTPISQVQGEEILSPLVKKEVTVQGIVTAIRKSGFYIQTPDDKVDGNPKTSEGIYVFTKDEPSAEIAVGNMVEVSGTVAEFRSERERYALFLTEIVEPKTKIISKENPLPKPYVLTEADLKTNGNPDQLERFEGMLLKIEELKVVAPTGGYKSTKEDKIISDGVFFGVLAKTMRPFREPGLDILKILFDKLPQTFSAFDMNSELIRVDSDGLKGGEAFDVTSGATIKNLVGVLDYGYSAYTFLPDPKIKPIIENNREFVKASPAGENEITVASFNIENFFDDKENSDLERKEEIVSKEYFEKRLKKTSLAIRNVVSMPDVLGIIEVENLEVLKKLAERINQDAEAAGQTNPKYEAFLEEGNDIRGIDVGFLVKTSKVKVKKVEQLAKDLKLEHKDANPKEKLFDRPPLLIEVEIPGEKPEENFNFTVIVNHFKSYLGIDDPKSGDRVQTKRRLEAEFLAKFIQDRQKQNPLEPIIVVGDFNAFQFNDGYNDLIGILKGNPAKNIISPSTQIYKTDLIDLVDYISEDNRYSYIFGGSAQVLDHILVNKPARTRAVKFGYARLNADFPKVYANDETRPERVSDHDVPVLYLSLKDKKVEEKSETPKEEIPVKENNTNN